MNRGDIERVVNRKKFPVSVPADNCVELKEDGVMSVNITDIQDGAWVVKLPSSQDGFLSKENIYTKICDYLIFVPGVDSADVILCELKSTKSDSETARACKQLKCTVPLVDYFLSAVKTHLGDKTKVKKHFLFIAEKSKPLPDEIVATVDKQAVHVSRPDTGTVKHSGVDVKFIVSDSDVPFSMIKP